MSANLSVSSRKGTLGRRAAASRIFHTDFPRPDVDMCRVLADRRSHTLVLSVPMRIVAILPKREIARSPAW
jgi:hypothetical protein